MSGDWQGGQGGQGSEGWGPSDAPGGFSGGYPPAAHQPDAMAPSYQPSPQPSVPAGWYTTPDGRTAWWDGFQWAAAPPPSLDSFYRPVESLGGAAQALLAVSAIVALFRAGAEFSRYQLVGKVIDDPTSVSFSELTDSDTLAGIAATVSVLVLIPTAIVFLVWLNRVMKNLDGPLRAGAMEYTSGWAVGWWFVPFANLVMPKRVMDEAWKASDPGQPGDPALASGWRHLRPPALMGWWWAAFIGGAILSRIAVGVNNGGGANAIHQSMLLSTISSLLSLIAAILAVLVVRDITTRQGQRAANLGARTL